MNKSIEIEELRVASNGEYIEFVINCPSDYEFREFNIQVGDNDEEYSIADSLFYEDGIYIDETDNRFMGQIPVSLLGVSSPEIYRIHLMAEHTPDKHTAEDIDIESELQTVYELPSGYSSDDGFYVKNQLVYNVYNFPESATGTKATQIEYVPVSKQFVYKYNPSVDLTEQPAIIQSGYTVNSNGDVYLKTGATYVQAKLVTYRVLDTCNNIPDEIYADAYISDVSHAYLCLIDDVLALLAKCTNVDVQDRVIRNYLILYAHQEALRLGYIDEATKWFKMINQCFSNKCGSGKRDRDINVGCGCSRPQYAESYVHAHTAGCGCRR